MKTPPRPARLAFRAVLALAAFAAAGSSAFAAAMLFVSADGGSIDVISNQGAVSNLVDLPGSSSILEGLALDPAGNLYAADGGTGSFIKVTPAGTWDYYASIGNHYPFGLAINSVGELFAAMGGLGSPYIAKITPAHVVSTFSTPAGGREFAGVEFDKNGDLFVVDDLAGKILKITPAGIVTTFVTIPTTGNLMGLAFDASGNLFVSDFGGPIRKVTPAGVVSTFVTLPSNAGVKGLAFDADGNLYAAEQNLNTIAKITPAGAVTGFASVYAPQFIKVVPEPSSLALLGGGILALFARKR